MNPRQAIGSLLTLFGRSHRVWSTPANFLLMQNLSWEAALDELPIALRTTGSSLNCRMLSCGCTTTMCLLVMVPRSLWTFGAMASWLVLFRILRQRLLLLVNTRIGRWIYDKIVHLFLLAKTNRLRLLIQKISRVRSTYRSLRDSRDSIPLFCRTWNAAASSSWLCQGCIYRICNACGCICRWGRLTHYDSIANLGCTKYIPSLSTGGIGTHCTRVD